MGVILHVLGTDTGVGKTILTAGLASALAANGHRVGVAKPFATGAGADGVAEDTATLAAALPGQRPEDITTWSAAPPLAPRVAAEQANQTVPVDAVATAVRERALAFDLLLVEGIGGVQTPLAESVTYLDFASGLGGAAVVVARPALGTLNHTRLTVDACRAAGVPVLGVICSHASPPDGDDPALASNQAALSASLPVDVWDAVGHLPETAGQLPSGPFEAAARAVAEALLATGTGAPAGPLVHEQVTRVRYGETDQMGMVYHGDYFQYFDMGRTELLRARGLPYAELERRGALLTVTEASCRYLSPARYDDRVRIRTELVDIRRVRLGFRYTIHRVADGVLLAEGATTLACVDPSGKPRRLPAELAGLLPAGGVA